MEGNTTAVKYHDAIIIREYNAKAHCQDILVGTGKANKLKRVHRYYTMDGKFIGEVVISYVKLGELHLRHALRESSDKKK